MNEMGAMMLMKNDDGDGIEMGWREKWRVWEGIYGGEPIGNRKGI